MPKSLFATFRPVNALNVTVSSSVSRNRNEMQWVAAPEENGETRFLVGEINQTIALISLRVTYMLTPNLSLQYWGQPFGSSGKYKTFKTITDANADAYTQRFAYLPTSALTLIDDEYHVDEDGNGMRDYSFDKPDFNFGQFRSNMVIRWEYIPGSTLFLVWTQERNGEFYDKDPNHNRYSLHFSEKAYNIFLMKFTYRFVL